MPWSSFLIIFACCAVSMYICRVFPAFAFAGKELPASLVKALNYIPVAAFAALVANDLVSVEAFATGLWPALLPFAAAIPVIIVALKTKSLALCIIVGVACYALLLLI